MTKYGGYTGNILRIDLTNLECKTETVDDRILRLYLGGAGLISYFLLKEVPPEGDPLNSQNKLIFANGPITGTSLPGSGRLCIGGRSPLTGGVAKSEAGGFFGAALKRAGFDAVIVQGKATKPVYLSIIDEKVELRDASHLWGKTTKQTETLVRQELDEPKLHLAMIGQGGENQVLFACIMFGLFSAAGRGGLGAIMGSKNLKAIAVKGSHSPDIASKDGLKILAKEFRQNVLPATAGLSDTGTSPAQVHFEPCGNLPINNFRDGVFTGHENITALRIKQTIRIGMEGCWACPVKCKKIVKMNEPRPVDPSYGGPEYETLGSLGSACGVDDLAAIAKAHELCNAYSLDTISTGLTISFAMELFDNGLLTKADTGGLDLSFGNSEAMLELIEQIVLRKGLGELLSLGSARAAQEMGGEAAKYAMHTKGLEFPAHEPRLNKALGLGYMVAPIGSDHMFCILDFMFSGMGKSGLTTVPDAIALGAEPSPWESLGPSKIYLAYIFSLKRILQDSMVLCGLIPWTYQMMTSQMRYVAGWDTTQTEQLRISERIVTAMRHYNIKSGMSQEDDVLPKRFFEPRKGGQFQGKLNSDQMNEAKQYYYSLMGWNERGVPSAAKLEELNIPL